MLGIALTAFLITRKVKGAILIGIITVTVAGFFFMNPTTGSMITHHTVFTGIGAAGTILLGIFRYFTDFTVRGINFNT